MNEQRCPPVVTEVDGVPIRTFGELYVYGQCPDYQPDNKMQQDNDRPREKIKPKKPWEITGSYFGVPAYLVGGGFPSRYSFFAPYGQDPDVTGGVSSRFNWPVNLIDGNPGTCWTSPRGGTFEHPLARGPISIRIDLAGETTVKEVQMVARAQGLPESSWTRDHGIQAQDLYDNPMPRDLKVMASQDGQHWDTVYKTENLAEPALGETIHLPVRRRRAKQIVLRGQDFGPMINRDVEGWKIGILCGYCWSLAEIRVLDEHGDNVALASRGAGITVDLGPIDAWDTQVMSDVAMAYRFDLGVKWMRCNYHGGNLQWHQVERERGKYVIDPAADQGITEATDNGINILMGLMYGNWLYADPPRPNELHRVEMIPFDPPPAPKSPEQIEAYKRWVRFMVNHLKDRVKWWEIWNEPSLNSLGFGESREGAQDYMQLIKAVVPVIREADPDAKILVGYSYYPWEIFKEEVLSEVACMVDALELPARVYELSLKSPRYRGLPENIRRYQTEVQAMGFKGIYVSEENQWFAEPHPPAASAIGRPPIYVKTTHIQQAKNMARLMLQHHGLNVVSIWQGGVQLESGTLGPAYYAYRTLCTIMDGAKPAEVSVVFDGEARPEHYAFDLPDDELMVALWLPGDSVDKHPGETTTVTLPNVAAKRVAGVDTLNGCTQDLNFIVEDGKTVVAELVIYDYPLVLRVTR